MNTHMWNHPVTAEQLEKITRGGTYPVFVVPPVAKVLACGEIGIGAMASVSDIVSMTQQLILT